MIRILSSALVALGLLVAAPLTANAKDNRPLEEWIEDLTRQGMDRLERALEGLERGLDRIPRYGPPEVTPEGDIIIPRREWPKRKDPEELPDVVET
ncbi:MAG: hypothetical protein QNJ94_03810 [Alphaproteobacteria bacterium]|nr:hypothetical protein [Alphaproteobacteria bacterium]